MSRIAKKPILIPTGVEANLSGNVFTVKGNKGTLQRELNFAVELTRDGNVIQLSPKKEFAFKTANAAAGTSRAIIQNMISGVTQGFERKLLLIGVGYRAQMQGDALTLSLGFSHPIKYIIPTGITVETPSQTEIVIKGIDKQIVGQIAADIRAFRPPEPYKGKGVRYANEIIILKEGKKK